MYAKRPIICVTGFLGAGKSHAAEMLAPGRVAAIGAPDDLPAALAVSDEAGPAVLELDGLGTASVLVGHLPPGTVPRVIAVADGVNLCACLRDPTRAPLIEAQLGAADVIVLSRGDIRDVGDAREALASRFEAPVIDIAADGLSVEEVMRASCRDAWRDAPPVDMKGDFRVWSYAGAAILTPEAAEAFLKGRPAGSYRISGQARLPSGGLDLQVYGRGRQTAGCPAPEETRIVAIGQRPDFSKRAMDLAWSEAVMQSSYQTGAIACR